MARALRIVRFLVSGLSILLVSCGTSSSPPGGEGAAAPTDASVPLSPSPDAGVDSGSPPGTFALQVKTEKVDGVLALRTNLPASVSACAAMPVKGAPCGDDDGDGLVDAWEKVALERLRPRIEVDEGEQLLSDPSAKLAFVGRVAPRSKGAGEAGSVLAFFLIGYTRDYGSCGLSSHAGDNERVVLELSVTGGDARMVRAYTAAHEGSAADDGHVYSGPALASSLRFDEDNGEPRWLVFSSRGKHATYANVETCAAHSAIPCLKEECGADNVTDKSGFRLLPPFVNAGEPDKRLVDDLGPVGFPGERAWDTTPFCGGLGGSSCASANADKLTVDPFP